MTSGGENMIVVLEGCLDVGMAHEFGDLLDVRPVANHEVA